MRGAFRAKIEVKALRATESLIVRRDSLIVSEEVMSVWIKKIWAKSTTYYLLLTTYCLLLTTYYLLLTTYYLLAPQTLCRINPGSLERLYANGKPCDKQRRQTGAGKEPPLNVDAEYKSV